MSGLRKLLMFNGKLYGNLMLFSHTEHQRNIIMTPAVYKNYDTWSSWVGGRIDLDQRVEEAVDVK